MRYKQMNFEQRYTIECMLRQGHKKKHIAEARKSCYRDDFELDVEGNVHALDATTIDLCLSVFWWAEFRKAKGGIVLYDIKTSIPGFLHISNASLHDVNLLDILPYEAGSFYVMDKGK
ncbi:Transposase, Gmet_2093 family [hydrothermal vent metagenome]|uniref:Transposase, Gmet_2093 family n=1 Tax=hydrothermal vent metagenome TaxID=652676 RepID=A0A3B0TGF1_9ZZZZ